MTTKDKILRATFLLLLEMGYDRVLVSDIQKKLGMSRGLLYRYFDSKNELFFAACREYFYDRYFRNADYDNMTLREFIDHAKLAVRGISNFDGTEIPMPNYNTLYSALIQCEPQFRSVALSEFEKARKVIQNSIKRGEVKNLPVNFVGATLLAILGRTSYITDTPSASYINTRILEDVETFYSLISL